MHIYTSILTVGELKDVVSKYYIPVDLHPRLPPPGLTMNKLPSRYIDIYLEHLEQRGLRDPFSTFFLAGHWFLFKNKTGGRAKKCFKEVNSSLKGWKKKFFLIDRRAVPDAMPWRHTDTDLHDDFPTHYNENDAASSRLDQNNREAIPEKSAFQKNIEKLNSKIAAAREKKDQKNLAKAQAKRTGEGGSDALWKKRKVCKNLEPDRSSLEMTLSPTPFHHATPKNVRDPLTVVPDDAAGAAANVEKEVVDLSVNSFYFAHHEDTEEGIVDGRFVPNWGIHDDLRICTFRACKELVSHLATPAEEEFLGNLMNVEVEYVDMCNRSDAHLMELDRLTTDFQREMQANNGLSKELSLLDAAHFACSDRERELLDRVKDLEKERDDWRQTASDQI
ncbi:hypothetical protein Tco_0727778 [Tanacetum coccineum]|uniref:Uncharacterized protein n=1 Tax=Tanacetum coccineum TaxID=301880 RepID=A0ABQ4YK46_9ASTR